MLSKIDRTPWPFPSATWDVIRGSRMVAKPNVPNSEAHIVPRLGRSQESAAFVYLREKKVFEPTTIHWIRTPGDIARRNAEAAVLREINDLNQRFDNFIEYLIWKMFSGTITLDYTDVQATIDYKMPASHKASVGTTWASATPAQITADLTAWRRLIVRDGRVPAGDIFLTEPTFNRIMIAFASTNTTNGLMSDRMKDEYFRTGVMSGFQGFNWHIQDSVYEDDAGTQTQFLADDSLLLGNFTANRPFELYEGPTADDEAPSGFTGKFAKTWKEKDPSARQYLLEWHALPVLTRPEQFVYVSDVTPP